MALRPKKPTTVPFSGNSPLPNGQAIHVAVVEADPRLRERLASFIKQAEGFSCVGVCGNGEDALRDLPCVCPDVVLMDASLPGMSGIECLQALKQRLPQTHVVMHTVDQQGVYLFDALKAGASGYLLKGTAGPRLLGALREASQGGLPFTRQMAQQVQDHFRQLAPTSNELDLLAPRQVETLRLLSQGLPYKQIASRMGISLDTVREYVKSIYTKFHVNSRTGAVLKFLRR